MRDTSKCPQAAKFSQIHKSLWRLEHNRAEEKETYKMRLAQYGSNQCTVLQPMENW